MSANSMNAIAIVAILWVLFLLALAVAMLVAEWKMFVKAGEPGWAVLVPLYNTYVIFKIAFGNGWWFLMMLVPLANVVFTVMCMFRLAKSFGKGTGFGFGLLFLSFIFVPILGYGDAQYYGPIPM